MKLIPIEEDNIRIDKYLIDKLGFTRSKIQKLIANDKILVNGKKIKNSYIIKMNDQIMVDDHFTEELSEIKAEDIKLDIVYEDEDVIVVNKPSGMVVHPACGHYSATLVNALLYHGKELSEINGKMRPGIIHRIDKDTSGLLLIAKNDEAHAILAHDLQEHKITRRYIALVDGVIEHEYGTIDAPIGRDPFDRKKMAVTDINAKNAVTHFKVLKRYNSATLIECHLETGRTHQIRLHMKYIGHPVINDPLYGNKEILRGFGQMLHAEVLGFYHPRTKKYLEFKADLPEDFKKILKQYE